MYGVRAMDVWGWLAVVFVVSFLAAAVWAIVHQRRQFPADRERVGEPDEPRNRDILKWFGTTFGGGHG